MVENDNINEMGKLTKILYKISDCLTEVDIDYGGHDVSDSVQPDVESCRSTCRSKGEGYFTFKVGQGTQWCGCKNSNAGRRQLVNHVSGETCTGEMNSKKRAMVKDLGVARAV